jgi:hypothetical protein
MEKNMPATKKSSNQKTETKSQTPTVNIAEVGRKYYDVLDVFSNKVVSKIVENSGQLNIDKSAIVEISKIITEETSMAKNWGIDQIIKAIRQQ